MKLETKYGVLEGTVEEFKELLDDKDLSFFSAKEVEEETKYKVVKEDIYSYYNSNIILAKGIVLLKNEYGTYEDTLGQIYSLATNTIENKLLDFDLDGVDSFFEEHHSRRELFKVELA